MGKTIEIANDLVKTAVEVTGEPNESLAVEFALADYFAVRHSKIALEGMFELAGQIQFYDGYDYKALRASKHHVEDDN
jgi:hypothetical protein